MAAGSAGLDCQQLPVAWEIDPCECAEEKHACVDEAHMWIIRADAHGRPGGMVAMDMFIML